MPFLIVTTSGVERRAMLTPMGLRWSTDVNALRQEQLAGFFADWPRRPSQSQHLQALCDAQAAVVVVADGEPGAPVVGFVTVVGDGVLVAFIPWLEVLPAWQGRGLGTELLRRAIDAVPAAYSVDLVCDEDVAPFYERQGWTRLTGMGLRRAAALPAT